MSKIKYELKCKLDRLNEDMKSWMKQVEHGVRMWSRLPDSTLYDIYDQILTLMYRKLVCIRYWSAYSLLNNNIWILHTCISLHMNLSYRRLFNDSCTYRYMYIITRVLKDVNSNVENGGVRRLELFIVFSYVLAGIFH